MGFRAWFYFRQGWSTYFAFIFAAVNTLTVTYYLAIENYPVLKEFFPNFVQYVLIITAIGIPILVAVGYAHYKKTPSYRAEADVWFESNPYWGRLIANSEILVQINLQLIELLQKNIQNNFTQEEIDKNNKIINEINNLINKRSLENKIDYEIFKKLQQLQKQTYDKK